MACVTWKGCSQDVCPASPSHFPRAGWHSTPHRWRTCSNLPTPPFELSLIFVILIWEWLPASEMGSKGKVTMTSEFIIKKWISSWKVVPKNCWSLSSLPIPSMNCVLVPLFHIRKWAPLGLFILPSLVVHTVLEHDKVVTSVSKTVPWSPVIQARWVTCSSLPKKHPKNCIWKKNAWLLAQNVCPWSSSNMCPEGFIFPLLVECIKSSMLLGCILCSKSQAVVLALCVSALAQTYPKVWCVTQEDHPRTREHNNTAELEWDSSKAHRGWSMP